jgi:hypothetical protein
MLKARPKAQIDKVVTDPVGWFKASGGDAARLAAGLVDKIGTRAEWGDAIAKIAGEDKSGDEVRPVLLPTQRWRHGWRGIPQRATVELLASSPSRVQSPTARLDRAAQAVNGLPS